MGLEAKEGSPLRAKIVLQRSHVETRHGAILKKKDRKTVSELYN